MTLDEYIGDPAPAPSLSASVAHVLLTRSPKHAWIAHPRLNPQWVPSAATESTDLGTLAHAMLLEGDGSRLQVVVADDWRTKDARRQRDDARAAGKLPVLVDRISTLTTMVIMARDAIRRAPEIASAFDDGQAEQTLMWQEGETWCRARPDWMTRDARVLVDYKTTAGSAEPAGWARGPLLSMGYDLQAAFGLRAAAVVHKPRDCSFIFMVQETDPPYAVSFVGLGPEFQAFAERKRVEAVELWRTCLARQEWPGYPPRIAWADPPPWAMLQWDDRYTAISATATDDVEL